MAEILVRLVIAQSTDVVHILSTIDPANTDQSLCGRYASWINMKQPLPLESFCAECCAELARLRPVQ